MKPDRLLRLNVGFLLKENTGYRRTFEFEAPEVHLAADLTLKSFRGQVVFSRTPQGLYASGRLAGEMRTDCGRCLEPYSQPLTANIAELFIFPPENARPGDLVVPEEGILDLTPLVREDMLLSMPLRPLCRPDCRGLCPNCGANLNVESCTCAEENLDPRLAALRVLLEK